MNPSSLTLPAIPPVLQRYLLAVELKDAKVVEEAKKITPVLRDKALSILSAKTPEILIDVQGREPLKQELIAGLKGLLKPGELRSVYITDIIIP